MSDLYLVDELLTGEERRIRKTLRAFCDAEVLPIINDYWERAEFPFVLLPKIAEAVFTFEGTDSVQALIVGREVTGIQAIAPRDG